jgi:hypothetical protein
MKTTIRSFSIILAFLSVTVSPQARATCQEGCLTNFNTVLGDDALLNNTGGENTAIGFEALLSNTGGYYNTAIGAFALNYNTTGGGNTAIGLNALVSNTTGGSNTATGYQALLNNTSAEANTATGAFALLTNTTGFSNTADGAFALENNTTGFDNTASGYAALVRNTTGYFNTANGAYALWRNTTGYYNTASGQGALYRTSGNNNIALGSGAGFNLTTGSNNIDIGNSGVVAEANTIRIGTVGTQTNTFIAGISGVTVAGGVGVIIDANGHLGTVVSSERFKEAVNPMDKASEAILALKPVTFRYKHDLDPEGTPQFGLVAEDVQKVNPDLVARDEQGKPYSVRYEAVNAMLLNEFLKEHKAFVELKKEIAALRATVKQEAAEIQKVNARLQTESVSELADVERYAVPSGHARTAISANHECLSVIASGDH